MLDLSNIIAIALGADDVLQVQDSLGTVLWRKSYLVTITAGSNGSVTVNGVSGNYSQRVAAGTTLTIEGTGDAGYDFDEWSDGVSTNPRTVTVTGDLTLSASFVQAVMLNYFYVEDISGQPNTLSLVKHSNYAPTIEPYYSTDQQTWTSMGTTSTTPITATVPANGKLYIKCIADSWGYVQGVDQNKSWHTMSFTGNHNIGGNIMSLLYGDNFEGQTTISTQHSNTFTYLFESNTHLIDASDLLLPATTVSRDTYGNMFKGCTNLTAAPAILPAPTLAQTGSYISMFEGCSSLGNAPVLMVEYIKAYDLYTMFKGCTLIDKIVTYADTVENYGTTNWLQNVAATGDFYALGSANWTIDSPSGVPVGWTLHHSLPQPDNEIWYESSDGQTIDFSTSGFNANIVSNTYADGKGVVKFDAAVTSTTDKAYGYRGSNKLTKISFPDSFTTVGNYTFKQCPLTELDLNNVTSVGFEAFDGNYIQQLHIPATLTTITNNPFRSAYITQITVDANNPTYNDGSAHNGSNCIMDGTTLMCGCVNTVIPDNCTVINNWAMSSLGITVLDCPASITTLNDCAADGNRQLRTVYARSSANVVRGAFSNGVPTGGTLYYTSGVNYQNWLNRLPSGWTAVLLCNTTISAGNNGSISVNGTSGNYHQPELVSGTQLTLVATPDAGYQFDSWSDGDTNASRTVTITADTTLTASFVAAQPASEPFYVEDITGNANTLRIKKSDANAPTIEVFSSTDKQTWTSMGTTSTTAITATIPANGKLYLKATANQWSNGNSNVITASGNHNIGGNIMSLLVGDNYEGATLGSYNYHFSYTFYNSTHLIDASDLVLPSDTTEFCYNHMFSGCTALTAVPATLPATTLNENCYSSMFSGCTSLTTAPALPATNLQYYCYDAMFEGCTALTTAPVLPATTLAHYCYRNMFRDCSSLATVTTYANTLAYDATLHWLYGAAATGDFYNLGSATYTSDDSGIPSGWTEHTSL